MLTLSRTAAARLTPPPGLDVPLPTLPGWCGLAEWQILDWHQIDDNRVRHLRDGREAFPAMLEAIDNAKREILLEMYWVGTDIVGETFRDWLRARALAGVAVFVSYDGVGSLGLFRSFWAPLLDAGGQVLEHSPVAPWRRRFSALRLLFRDHRKILVVDGAEAFCGGLNLAAEWLPLEQGGSNWRDDVVQVRGPAALELRTLSCQTWWRIGHENPLRNQFGDPPRASRVRVLANRIARRPNRRIRRAYLLAIRRARVSIDLTNPYFLPGPLFLHALRRAHARGVKIRVLIPRVSDVWLVDIAMRGVIDNLVRHGIAAFAYERAVLHAKTAILDGKSVIVGSHNLDTFSWRFDLEANLMIDDAEFAATMTRSFERDLLDSSAWSVNRTRGGLLASLLAWFATKLRGYL